MQTKLKKRRTGESPLETGASDGAQEIKEEDVMKERGPAPSSTLSKIKEYCNELTYQKDGYFVLHIHRGL